MFKVVIIISCSSRQLIMDGWPGASTILNFAEAELPLKVILKLEIPKLNIVFPPLFRTALQGLKSRQRPSFL